MGLMMPVFWIFAVVSFLSGMITSLQLAEFLSRQTPLLSNTTLLGAGFSIGCNNPFFFPFLWDGMLLCLFIVQHSGMASHCWKTFISDLGLTVIERALYVIATSAVLQVIIRHWEPLFGPSLWWIDTSERPALWLFFLLLHIVSWILIYAGNLVMDLPELLGIKQVYYYSIGADDPLTYKTRGAQRLYQHMRHAGVYCLLVVFWVHPIMTLGRLLLALAWTFYLLFGQKVREEDHQYITEQLTRKKTDLASGYELAN